MEFAVVRDARAPGGVFASRKTLSLSSHTGAATSCTSRDTLAATNAPHPSAFLLRFKRRRTPRRAERIRIVFRAALVALYARARLRG